MTELIILTIYLAGAAATWLLAHRGIKKGEEPADRWLMARPPVMFLGITLLALLWPALLLHAVATAIKNSSVSLKVTYNRHGHGIGVKVNVEKADV